MSQRGNTPAELAELGRCPRARDGGAGPRACGEVTCRLNLRDLGGRGPVRVERLRLQLECEDSCAEDVRVRALRAGTRPTHAQVGVLMGISKQAVAQLEARAIAKLRRALVPDGES